MRGAQLEQDATNTQPLEDATGQSLENTHGDGGSVPGAGPFGGP